MKADKDDLDGEIIMQIFVDADACPVVDIVETIAEKYNIPTTLLCDTNHVLYSCLLYTSPSPREEQLSRMPTSA